MTERGAASVFAPQSSLGSVEEADASSSAKRHTDRHIKKWPTSANWGSLLKRTLSQKWKETEAKCFYYIYHVHQRQYKVFK